MYPVEIIVILHRK